MAGSLPGAGGQGARTAIGRGGSDGRFAGAVDRFEAAVRAGSQDVPAAFDALLPPEG